MRWLSPSGAESRGTCPCRPWRGRRPVPGAVGRIPCSAGAWRRRPAWRLRKAAAGSVLSSSPARRWRRFSRSRRSRSRALQFRLIGIGADQRDQRVPDLLGAHAAEDGALEVVGRAGRRLPSCSRGRRPPCSAACGGRPSCRTSARPSAAPGTASARDSRPRCCPSSRPPARRCRRQRRASTGGWR